VWKTFDQAGLRLSGDLTGSSIKLFGSAGLLLEIGIWSFLQLGRCWMSPVGGPLLVWWGDRVLDEEGQRLGFCSLR
jgi:hypothetical protein